MIFLSSWWKAQPSSSEPAPRDLSFPACADNYVFEVDELRLICLECFLQLILAHVLRFLLELLHLFVLLVLPPQQIPLIA